MRLASFQQPSPSPWHRTAPTLKSSPTVRARTRMNCGCRFQWSRSNTPIMIPAFTASEQGLAAVLRDVAKRGLIYVDDGSSARSIAGQIGTNNLPFAKTDVVLDAVPTPIEIDRALARLEM